LRIVVIALVASASHAFMVSPSLGLRQAKVDSGLYAARSPTLSQLRMQGGAWGNEPEKAKASLELMQIRFAQVDVASMKTWIQKWPKGTIKDAFGLPKLMLPVGTEPSGDGVRINWKGSADPWMQVDLEGDTVRVYRQSMLAGSFGQVSALKEREEKKICTKLKEDLDSSAFSAAAVERELPKIEKPKTDEEKKEEEDRTEAKSDDDAAPPPAADAAKSE